MRGGISVIIGGVGKRHPANDTLNLDVHGSCRIVPVQAGHAVKHLDPEKSASRLRKGSNSEKHPGRAEVEWHSGTGYAIGNLRASLAASVRCDEKGRFHRNRPLLEV
jgi:hypothetical protein